MWARA